MGRLHILSCYICACHPPQRLEARSRHATTNINLLRDAAISSGVLTINPDPFIQRLASNSTCANKDHMILILAVNGIISSDIPNETQKQSVDEISDHVESDKE